MTTDKSTEEKSTARLRRAAIIKKTAVVILLLNTFSYAATLLVFKVLSPDLDNGWAFDPTYEVPGYSIFLAVFATAVIGGAFETECRERACNNTDISTARAVFESTLRLIGWLFASLCSAVVMVITVRIAQTIFGV